MDDVVGLLAPVVDDGMVNVFACQLLSRKKPWVLAVTGVFGGVMVVVVVPLFVTWLSFLHASSNVAAVNSKHTAFVILFFIIFLY